MAFQKGHEKIGGRKVGTLNGETLSKLAARARFEEKASQEWERVVEALIEKNPVYVADQLMGKAPDNVNVKIEESSFTAKEIAKIKGNVKEKLADDQ